MVVKGKKNRWLGLVSGSRNRRIFGAALLITCLTVIAKLAVAVKELALAGYYGTGVEVDAILIALLLPMFAINVLAGSFSAALMPVYVRTRSQVGAAAARDLISSVSAFALVFLVAAALVLALVAPLIIPLLGSGFDVETQSLALSLFYWLLPVLVITGIGHIYTIALNAGERFTSAALAPAMTPIGAVVALVFWNESLGIHAVALGTIIGALIELSIFVVLTSQHDLLKAPRWFGFTSELKSVLKQYSAMVAGAVLMSATVLVDHAMAAMLPSGSVSSLNYASRLVALIIGVGALALGTAILPHFSQMVADRAWKDLQNTYRTYRRLTFIISIPLTFLIFAFSQELIGLIFERGAFNADDTLLVSETQAFYTLQLPFYIASILVVRLISALQENRILFVGALISLPLNILLNYFFMWRYGISGIAMSTACVYAISFLFLSLMLKRKLTDRVQIEQS